MPTKVGDWSLDVWGRGGSWEYPKNGSWRFGFLGKGRKLGIPISWEYPHHWEPESPGPGAHSPFLEGAGFGSGSWPSLIPNPTCLFSFSLWTLPGKTPALPRCHRERFIPSPGRRGGSFSSFPGKEIPGLSSPSHPSAPDPGAGRDRGRDPGRDRGRSGWREAGRGSLAVPAPPPCSAGIAPPGNPAPSP